MLLVLCPLLLFLAPVMAFADLSSCPNSPNCVSSQAEPDSRHYVKPLEGVALEDIKALLADWKRVELVEESSDYLHYTFKTRVFRFVDDVEFSSQSSDSVVHVRSASRKGYWDLGANRRRIAKIRRHLSSDS